MCELACSEHGNRPYARFSTHGFAEKASFVSSGRFRFFSHVSLHGGHFDDTNTKRVDDPLPFTKTD